MVLGDLFSGLFSKKNKPDDDRNNDTGATGLPRNIESDFLRQSEEKRTERQDHMYREHPWGHHSMPSFQIYIDGEEDRENEQDFNFSHDLFHQFDVIMKDMFQGFDRFHDDHGFHGFRGLEDGSDNNTENESQGSSKLRDKMLKDPDRDDFSFFKSFKIPSYDENELEQSNPRTMMDWSWTFPFENNRKLPKINEYKDHDLDQEIQSGKSTIEDVLNKGAAEHAVPDDRSLMTQKGSSFGSFSSTVTRKRADGIVECQKTVKDSEGNEQVTVIRKIGDQTHKKITSKDSTGNEEVLEDLLNMDEGDLEKFEEAWAKSEVKDESIPPALWKNFDGQGGFLGGSLFESVKDLFFPRNNGD